MIEERHFIYRLIKLKIQSITEAPVEVLRAGFRKDVKLMSIIPGKLKGQPHQLSFKFIRSANRLPMHPSSTLRPVVEMRGVEPLSENPSEGLSPSAFHDLFPLYTVHGKTEYKVAS